MLVLVVVTTTDETGAAFRYTLQMSSAPGVNGFGEQVTNTGFSRSTTNVADADVPDVAVIVTDDRVAVSDALAANVADTAPAATLTLAGTVTVVRLLVSATLVPPDGAGAESVTVHVVFVPPTSVDTGQLTLLTPTVDEVLMVTWNVLTTDAREAVTVAVPLPDVAAVAVNCAVDVPAFTRTDAGT